MAEEQLQKTETKEVQKQEQQDLSVSPGFQNTGAWALMYRQAKMLSGSKIVPRDFQGESNIPNCIIALEMANRTGFSPFMVMQNIYMVYERPGWSSQFVIACINKSGRFTTLNFECGEDPGNVMISGKPFPNKFCVAWANDTKTGAKMESPRVTMEMARAEGWLDKKGSKWQTMSDLMLRYRAATFFGRLYCPDMLMGMETKDEIVDVETLPNATAPKIGNSFFNPTPKTLSDSRACHEQSRTELEKSIGKTDNEKLNQTMCAAEASAQERCVEAYMVDSVTFKALAAHMTALSPLDPCYIKDFDQYPSWEEFPTIVADKLIANKDVIVAVIKAKK